jgi:hypothetical protein
MSRDIFMGVVSGRLPWSEAFAAGDITVLGDIAAVDRFRVSLDNKGFAG